jgi:hypothetical protein
VHKKLDVVRPCQGVIAEGELHGRRFEIPNPSRDDLRAFVGREGLLRSDDDDMPGPLYRCAVGLYYHCVFTLLAEINSLMLATIQC